VKMPHCYERPDRDECMQGEAEKEERWWKICCRHAVIMAMQQRRVKERLRRRSVWASELTLLLLMFHRLTRFVVAVCFGIGCFEPFSVPASQAGCIEALLVEQ